MRYDIDGHINPSSEELAYFNQKAYQEMPVEQKAYQWLESQPPEWYLKFYMMESIAAAQDYSEEVPANFVEFTMWFHTEFNNFSRDLIFNIFSGRQEQIITEYIASEVMYL